MNHYWLLTEPWWGNNDPQWIEKMMLGGPPKKWEGLEGVRSLLYESDHDIIKEVLEDCNKRFPKDRHVTLDIGTYYGCSAILLAKYGKFDVVTIDPNCKFFNGQPETRGPIQQERVKEVRDNFARHKVDHKIIRLDGLSEDIIWPRELSIPFLMIDGSHLELNVLHEYSYFGRFVPKGGYIAFHDYGKPHWPGVVRTAEEAVRFDGFRVSHKQGYLCVLQRED